MITTYAMHMPWGETQKFRADLVEAAAPIELLVDDDGTMTASPTGYQTADARHRLDRAARLVLQSLGREFYALDGDNRPDDELLTALVEAVRIEALAVDDSEDLVLVETMPDQHRDSHRKARNWGTYPRNGAVRSVVTRASAEAAVAADADGYDNIVRDATPADIAELAPRSRWGEGRLAPSFAEGGPCTDD